MKTRRQEILADLRYKIWQVRSWVVDQSLSFEDRAILADAIKKVEQVTIDLEDEKREPRETVSDEILHQI